MIQTRDTIFNSILFLFRRLFKLADQNPKGFRDTLYAVILNDMKEWEEYIGESNPKAESILKKFIQGSSSFRISRFLTDLSSYKNVNTSLNNYTWQRIWDKQGVSTHTPSIILNLNMLLWIGDGTVFPTVQPFTYTLSILANTKTVVIRTNRLNTVLANAVNASFPADNLTSQFVKTTNGNYVDFTLTLPAPLNEQINITLQ